MVEVAVQHAMSARRLQVLTDLSLRTADASTATDTCTRAAAVLATLPDISFALLFVVDVGHDLRLAAATSPLAGHPDDGSDDRRAMARVAAPELWGLDECARGGDAMVLRALDERHREVLSLVRCEPRPASACVVRIPGPSHGPPLGYVVVGLHPLQHFDAESRAFLHLLALGLGATLAALRAREAEERHERLLDEIEKATSTFFNYVSHELRTPLHAILGWAQVLNRDGVDAPQLTRGLDAIERNARTQSQMVDALVALRRGMSGQGLDPIAALAVVPEVSAPMPPAETAPAAPLDAELVGLTVLVVDDNVDARDVVGEVLMRAGARVIAAASGEEGLSLLARQHPDLIVSDLGLPGVDGYSFMRQVRSLDESAGGGTPAVALSAFVLPADRERALRSGYQMHLAKPAEQSELVTVCASLTGRLA